MPAMHFMCSCSRSQPLKHTARSLSLSVTRLHRHALSSSLPDSLPPLRVETLLVNSSYSSELHGPFAPIAAPLYQSATFAAPSAISAGVYDYTRSGNPTRAALQQQLAALERADHAFVFTSGMAALTVVTQLLAPNDAILCSDDAYGGTVRLLSRVTDTQRNPCHYTDLTDLSAVEHALAHHGGRVKLILAESPTNPLMKVVDIRALASLAHVYGAWLSVDNTMMSPLLQLPLALGADIVMESATKFLSGHSDAMCGVLATNDTDLAARIAFLQNATGNALAPFDCWLVLRGVKTLAVRMKQQQTNAGRVANFLAAHPFVTRVHFVGLDAHPQSALHRQQSAGSGSVLSFETLSVPLSISLVNAVRLAKRAVSFGGVTSSIELPFYFSHASVPSQLRAAGLVSHVDPGLVRLSVGIEDADDLIDDLRRAFDIAARNTATSETTTNDHHPAD